jgi:hypothetical protein
MLRSTRRVPTSPVPAITTATLRAATHRHISVVTRFGASAAATARRRTCAEPPTSSFSVESESGDGAWYRGFGKGGSHVLRHKRSAGTGGQPATTSSPTTYPIAPCHRQGRWPGDCESRQGGTGGRGGRKRPQCRQRPGQAPCMPQQCTRRGPPSKTPCPQKRQTPSSGPVEGW